MWGGSINDDIEFPASLNGLRTLVLVGRTGNGKSATGNSIIGTKKFVSRISFVGVTTTSELKTTVLKDGQMLNVIDTPGLFNPSVDAKFIEKEIVKCIKMAGEGIHVVLVVISVGSSVSEQQEVVISSLRSLFGNKINDYMILVLTGGEQLEENEQTFEDFLEECPSLKETLSMCGGRCVIFDNMTKDQMKKENQVHELFSLVNMVLTKNNGKPYTDEVFSEMKRGTPRLDEDTERVQALKRYIKQEISDQIEKMDKSFEEQLKRYAEMAKSRLKEFEERWIAREKAGNDEICKLIEKLERIKAHNTTIGINVSNRRNTCKCKSK